MRSPLDLEPIKARIEECEYTYTDLVKLIKEVEALRAREAQMLKALERASETIHGEFCGRKHHAECVAMAELLAVLHPPVEAP